MHFIPPTVHKSPVWVPPAKDLRDVSSLPEREVRRRNYMNHHHHHQINLTYQEALTDWCVVVTCLFSPVFLCFTDVVRWSDISHNALCHVMNQCQLYTSKDREVENVWAVLCKHWKVVFRSAYQYLSLSTVGSVMVRDIMAMRYMWSDTLSGFFTFLYTQPVLGTL